MNKNIKFSIYSESSKEVRDQFNYIKIKRLVLRLEQSRFWHEVFDFISSYSKFSFALKYYDIEDEANLILYPYYNYKSEQWLYSGTNFLCSLYEQDRGFFQTFLNFIIKESSEFVNIDNGIISEISSELLSLGYIYDGGILRATSGESIIEDKINNVIENELKKINPDLIEIRKGALESLLSNQPDKARHVASSCRALINNLLKDLVPTVKDEGEEESDIKKRLKVLFGDSESTYELIKATANLIQTLNKVQSKGDHFKIDESLAHFVFEITDKLVYFILIYKR